MSMVIHILNIRNNTIKLDIFTNSVIVINMIYDVNTCLLKWMEEQPEKCGLIQQLNCFQVQGGGIALRIKEKYPVVYDADVLYGRRGDKNKLGKFCVVEVLPNKFCYGYYGQYNYGGNTRNTSYDAFDTGLKSIEMHARDNGLKTIGLPKNMGCRLGGGSWAVIHAIITDIFIDSPLELFICNYDG